MRNQPRFTVLGRLAFNRSKYKPLSNKVEPICNCTDPGCPYKKGKRDTSGRPERKQAAL